MRPRATRKRSRPCLFRSLRSPTNALHSPSYYYWASAASPYYTSELNGNFVCMYVCMYVCLYMSSTDRGQCACVPAQRANVAGLASSTRCARPQMLCILLVIVYTRARVISQLDLRARA